MAFTKACRGNHYWRVVGKWTRGHAMAICLNCPSATVVEYSKGVFGPCEHAVGQERARTASEYYALYKEAAAREAEQSGS